MKNTKDCAPSTACGCIKDTVSCVKSNLKLILLIIGICGGIGLGFGLRAADIHKNARKTSYVLFIGELFQSLLRFIIVPVIVTTLVSRMACSTGLTIGPAGRRSVMFFLNTVFYAAGVGLFISGLIGPGHYGSGGGISAGDAKKTPQRVTMTADTVMDFLRNMFLPNAVLASIAQYQTILLPPSQVVAGNSAGNNTFATTPSTASTLQNNSAEFGNESLIVVHELMEITSWTNNAPRSLSECISRMTPGRIKQRCTITAQFIIARHYQNVIICCTEDYSDWIMTRKIVEGTNVIGMVLVSIFFGMAINRLGESGKIVVDFFRVLNNAVIVLLEYIMRLAPAGIMLLIAGQILKAQDPKVMFIQLGLYVATVLIGFLVHVLLFIPAVCFVLTRRNPYRAIYGGGRAYAAGFVSTSTAATLPITTECCETNNNVDPRVSRVTLPIAATMSFDGIALYVAVAAIFVAQTENTLMDFGKTFVLSSMASAVAASVAGVPEVNFVTLVMILDGMGLPLDITGLMLAVDLILIRFCTVATIMIDLMVTSAVQHLCRNILK